MDAESSTDQNTSRFGPDDGEEKTGETKSADIAPEEQGNVGTEQGGPIHSGAFKGESSAHGSFLPEVNVSDGDEDEGGKVQPSTPHLCFTTTTSPAVLHGLSATMGQKA